MIGGIAPRARTQESPARAHSPWGKGRSPCAWVAHIATLRIEALRPRATAQPGARKRTRDSTHYPGTYNFDQHAQKRRDKKRIPKFRKCMQCQTLRCRLTHFNYCLKLAHSGGTRISRRSQPRPNGSGGNSSPRLGGSAGLAALSTRCT